MTDAPWDEGPVSALRARIQELEYEVAKQTDIAATASEQAAIWGTQLNRALTAATCGWCRQSFAASPRSDDPARACGICHRKERDERFNLEADRDRAVEAVRQLRAAMVTVHGKLDEVVKSYSGYKSWDFYGICFHEADRLSQMLAATAEWETP